MSQYVTQEQSLTIPQVLHQEGRYVGTVSGRSMYPMLRHHRDTIVIEPPQGRLKRHDVALYQVGDRYILHRVIRVKSHGYDIRGDNCFGLEKDILDGQIIGVLTAFYRGEGQKPVNMRGMGYGLYVWGWRMLYPVRYVLAMVKNKFRKKHHKP